MHKYCVLQFFSFICMSSLSCVQRCLSKKKLVKTLLHTQLKQTYPKPQLHILAEIIVLSIIFVDELRHCNLDMHRDLHLLVPVFLYLVFNIFGCYVIS